MRNQPGPATAPQGSKTSSFFSPQGRFHPSGTPPPLFPPIPGEAVPLNLPQPPIALSVRATDLRPLIHGPRAGLPPLLPRQTRPRRIQRQPIRLQASLRLPRRIWGKLPQRRIRPRCLPFICSTQSLWSPAPHLTRQTHWQSKLADRSSTPPAFSSVSLRWRAQSGIPPRL